MVQLILNSKQIKEQKDFAKEQGRKLCRDKIFEIAQTYYKRMPKVKELWIRLIGKPDLITGKINTIISAADKDNLHKINIPIQGGQMWYTNQTTGDIRLEWVLPFSAKKKADVRHSVTEGNRIIEKSFDDAAKFLGRDLISGKILYGTKAPSTLKG